jgi:hypothetical protein
LFWKIVDLATFEVGRVSGRAGSHPPRVPSA